MQRKGRRCGKDKILKSKLAKKPYSNDSFLKKSLSNAKEIGIKPQRCLVSFTQGLLSL